MKITQFVALKYRIPNIKYNEIPYTQNPWQTLTLRPEIIQKLSNF